MKLIINTEASHQLLLYYLCPWDTQQACKYCSNLLEVSKSAIILINCDMEDQNMML